MTKATEAVLSALLWLKNRGGDGVFDKNQVLNAAGERAPYMRSTWTKLCRAGWAEQYLNGRRIRIAQAGQHVDLRNIRENDACDEWEEA